MGKWVRQAAAAAAPPALFLALVGYFGWNATQGERGLQSYSLRQAQLRMVQADLAKVELERDQLQRRVGGLSTQRLDLDTLDERARAILNLGDPADFLALFPPGKHPF